MFQKMFSQIGDSTITIPWGSVKRELPGVSPPSLFRVLMLEVAPGLASLPQTAFQHDLFERVFTSAQAHSNAAQPELLNELDGMEFRDKLAACCSELASAPLPRRAVAPILARAA